MCGIVGVLNLAELPPVQKPVLLKGDFGDVTLPQVLKVNAWVVVIPAAALIVAALALIESAGL